MHLDLSTEALLVQLGYTKNEQTMKQMNDIIQHTKGFAKFSQHLPAFSDALAVEKAFIAMSNSKPYLKLKCNADSTADNLSAFTTLVRHWAEKYKLTLEQVERKDTYYILGQK